MWARILGRMREGSVTADRLITEARELAKRCREAAARAREKGDRVGERMCLREAELADRLADRIERAHEQQVRALVRAAVLRLREVLVDRGEGERT